MKRSLWRAQFDISQFGKFDCPTCGDSKLKIVEGTLAENVSDYSSSKNNPHDWEPTWIDEGFVALLKCSKTSCGQVVSVAGSKETTEFHTYDEDGELDWGYSALYRPRNFHPAPIPIEIPDECPDPLRAALKSAFEIMWSDASSSAAKIRFSLEILLDHLAVPRSAPNKKGKIFDLTLNDRIDRLAKDNDNHKDTLHALRVVGNLGAHEGKISREALLDALELYEHALDDVVGKKSIKIKALAKKLIDSGKKPKAT